MQRVDTKVRSMVRVAMLAAVSIILYMPMFEIPMFLPWLKLDFSTMPALLAGFAMGPLYGMIVVLIKCLVHIPMGTSAGIGELADFLCSAALVLPAAVIYRAARKRNAAHEDAVSRNRRAALVGMLVSVVIMVVVAVLTNQYIMLPMYAKFAGMEGIIAMADNPAITSMTTLFIYGVIPFNAVKGLLLSLVTFLLYKPLSPLLHDKRAK